jgi:hypothetical protein
MQENLVSSLSVLCFFYVILEYLWPVPVQVNL